MSHSQYARPHVTSHMLSLPPAIRQEIYRLAGLVYGGEICFRDQQRPTYRNTRPADYQYPTNPLLRTPDHQYTVPSFKMSQSLLRTCTALNVEVSKLLYSTNRFVFRIRCPADFAVLSNLGQHSLPYLKYLTIAINHNACHTSAFTFPRCKNGGRPFRPGAERDHPIDHSNPNHQELLLAWITASKFVLANTGTNQLTLHLLCDCATYEAAAQVVAPLSSVRKLADCSIRLGIHPDVKLQTLSRDTVLRLTSTDAEVRRPFRYQDLPGEIRYKVLEHTDLVTPLREVEWSPRGFSLRYSHSKCSKPYSCSPDFHHSCQFRHCFRYDGNTGCFCHRYHAAFDLRCRCWSPP